jgi:ABC-type multidrug transport system fused ATPase/permease subunit
MLSPDSGLVLYDGIPAKDYFLRGEYRIGYVGAEPFLIEGSILDNLLYGRDQSYQEAEVWEALERAYISSWIRGLPRGLESPISENGEGLSSGQKQRLCLARALLSKPNILILDEISANLDLETEAAIAETIKDLKGSCTTLIVSHREGLVKYVENRLHLGPERNSETNSAARA